MRDVNNELDANLSRWLIESKRLVMSVAKRSRALHELCPFMGCGAESRNQSLRELAVANAEIEKHCAHLCEIENESGNKIGCSALLGPNEISRAVFIATVLLIAARMHRLLRVECRTVGEIIDLSAGSCPIAILTVRDAFRAPDGVLRRFLHLTPETTICQSNADLCDASLALVCNRLPNSTEAAYAALGVNEVPPIRSSRR